MITRQNKTNWQSTPTECLIPVEGCAHLGCSFKDLNTVLFCATEVRWSPTKTSGMIVIDVGKFRVTDLLAAQGVLNSSGRTRPTQVLCALYSHLQPEQSAAVLFHDLSIVRETMGWGSPDSYLALEFEYSQAEKFFSTPVVGFIPFIHNHSVLAV